MSIFTDEQTALLRRAAEAFGNGRFVDGDFLAENDVSSDDAAKLLNALECLLLGFVNSPDWVQHGVVLMGAQDAIGPEIRAQTGMDLTHLDPHLVFDKAYIRHLKERVTRDEARAGTKS